MGINPTEILLILGLVTGHVLTRFHLGFTCFFQFLDYLNQLSNCLHVTRPVAIPSHVDVREVAKVDLKSPAMDVVKVRWVTTLEVGFSLIGCHHHEGIIVSNTHTDWSATVDETAQHFIWGQP